MFTEIAFWLQDSIEAIVDMKEHDVPYHIRFCIDEDVRCGHWFNVSSKVHLFSTPTSATQIQTGNKCWSLCKHGTVLCLRI